MSFCIYDFYISRQTAADHTQNSIHEGGLLVCIVKAQFDYLCMLTLCMVYIGYCLKTHTFRCLDLKSPPLTALLRNVIVIQFWFIVKEMGRP